MLFAYSQPSGQNREAADLRPIIERAVELIRPQAASQNVTVRCRFNDAVPPLLLNAREIQLVATNILTNALDVMPRGGRTTVHCEASERDRLLTLTIADTGPGIPEENLRRVFEPFFTTKENWRSTGLGLTVCYKVIHDHGGRIRARNRPEGGAEFVIELPLPPKQAARLA
jgi:two-component system NtrC family sensor kinase